MGGFEWTREASRRPFVINGILYSNGIAMDAMAGAERLGFLQSARWTRVREAHGGADVEAGEEIFRFQCHACHTVHGFNNDIVARTRGMSYGALYEYIGKIHQIRYFMPPFAGNDSERSALAAFITKGLQGREIEGEKQVNDGGAQGKGLFLKHCTLCHPESLVKARTAGWELKKIRLALDSLNRLQPAMPDFKAPPAEKDFIAGYIYSLNNPQGFSTEKPDSDERRGNR